VKTRIANGIFLSLIIVFLSFGCRKNDVLLSDSDALLTFSSDTVMFDTIFSSMGSVTKQLRVYNPYKQKVLISNISLAEGDASAYQINVDGRSGSYHSNIELAAGDSLYIFVRVTIDPTNLNSPFVVRDSILFELNGHRQDVDLYAWGQDAHFILPDTEIEGLPPFKIIAHEGETVVWTNEKPYVVLGYAVVDSTAHLVVEAGTRIHFYNNAGMWIYKGGSIEVNGTLDDPVVFQGTRTEEEYKMLPAQWDRIWINESAQNSTFNYAIIQNGTIGIQAETLNTSMGNTLVLNNTKILNMSGWGLFTRFYKIEANNLLVANAGSSLLNLTTGGHYSFKNSTFGNYWSYGVRNDPSLHLSDYYMYSTTSGDVVYSGVLEQAYFGDCIFYGGLDEELLIDSLPNSGNDFPYLFDHCLLKTTQEPNLITQSSLFNDDPLFADPYAGIFYLDTLSPAIDKGVPMGNPNDLEGQLRDANPDLGAYEYKTLTTNQKRK